jgi:hypothetical protein
LSCDEKEKLFLHSWTLILPGEEYSERDSGAYGRKSTQTRLMAHFAALQILFMQHRLLIVAAYH